MEEVIDAYAEYVIGGAVFMFIILFLWLITLGVKLNRLRRRYNQMMNTEGMADLEEVMIQIHHDLEQLKENQTSVQQKMQQITEALSSIKGYVGIHRYHAFDSHQGNNLSFSLAIINKEQDGVIISGLHARDQSYIFAKPMKQGRSEFALTAEEKKAINLALQQE